MLFWLFPIVASLFLSFTDYRLLGSGYNFVGVDNFIALFRDATFVKSVINTLIFTVGTLPFTTCFAIVLAIFLNGRLPLKTFFQSVYFFPSMVSLVVVALIFTSLYARGGYIQLLCGIVGVPYPPEGFLFSTATALRGGNGDGCLDGNGVLHAALSGGIAVDSQRAVRSGATGWRQRLATIPRDHFATSQADVTVCRRAQQHQVVPDLRRGLCDDEGGTAEFDE